MTPDGTLNDKTFDIKAIEGTGRNNIKRKFNEARSQDCTHIVLYYPMPAICEKDIVRHSYNQYLGVLRKTGLANPLTDIWIVIEKQLIRFV